MAALTSASLQASQMFSSGDQIYSLQNDHFQPSGFNDMPLLASRWPATSHAPAIRGMHDNELHLLQSNDYDFSFKSNYASASLLSPHLGCLSESGWSADTDISTPTTVDFNTDGAEAYFNLHINTIRSQPAMIPSSHPRQSLPSSASPTSSPSDLHSPERFADQPLFESSSRPAFSRAVSAPDPHISLKRAISDDEGAVSPSPADDAKLRGRKRQRIPHTAVERRYRENLNAHLERLRFAVPALASKRNAVVGSAQKPHDAAAAAASTEGVKPSKCEILHGAIEHIFALTSDNAMLQGEVQALRQRLADLEQWCGPQA